MSDEILNIERLPGNHCLGCGQHNPHGLHIELRRAPDGERVVGSFLPQEHHSGFPGVTHGGALYTALDCLAAWTASMLREERALWLLRSAQVTYHRPAHPGEVISLEGRISEHGDSWRAVTIRGVARNASGDAIADATMKVIPVPVDEFVAIAGVDALPENWRTFLDRVAERGDS
jgi:acyl-coenzyme A thioesterase PaaI-like protein